MSNQTYAQFLSKLSIDINNNFLIASSAIGIPSNLISIFIFSRLINAKTNMGFLYVWQTVIDFLLLTLNLFVFRPQLIFGRSLTSNSEFACRFIQFFRRFVFNSSAWITVMITFDRFIFICYGNNQRFNIVKKKKTLTGIILAIFVFIAVLNIPAFFFYISRTGSCTITPLLDSIVDTLSILMRTILPFCIMLILNIIMIRKIFHTSRSTFNQNPLFKKEFQFTAAVMAYDFYFFFLNFPLCIYNVFYDVNEIMGTLNDNQTVFSASYSLVSAIANSLSLCVQTLSIFSYFVFNKLYRQEVLFIFRKIICFILRQPSNYSVSGRSMRVSPSTKTLVNNK